MGAEETTVRTPRGSSFASQLEGDADRLAGDYGARKRPEADPETAVLPFAAAAAGGGRKLDVEERKTGKEGRAARWDEPPLRAVYSKTSLHDRH